MGCLSRVLQRGGRLTSSPLTASHVLPMRCTASHAPAPLRLQLAWGVRSEAPPAPPSDGTLKSPFAIALDEAGVLYVQDNGNYRLQKFVTST